ncbi:hypothetical protein GGH19_002832 [Coemansia sp. RSA 1807]|nr:hypothetical protein GGH19_002832 [Coemansia sp. RSA 1807]
MRLSESDVGPRMFGRKRQSSDVGPAASERPRRQVAQRVAQVASKVVRALSVRKRNRTDTQGPPFVQNYRAFGSASQMLTQPMHAENGQSDPSREISRHRKEPGSQGRLAQSFPSEARTLERDFVCSLDHAGTRWYGRMYVCRSSVCFTGSGISLSTTKPANISVVSLPTEMRAEWQSFQSVQHANKCEGRKIWRRSAVKIAFVDVTRVSKEMTLGVCPNAITVATARRHYIFTNFMRRDCAFGLLAERWQQAVRGQEPAIVTKPGAKGCLDPCAETTPSAAQHSNMRPNKPFRKRL